MFFSSPLYAAILLSQASLSFGAVLEKLAAVPSGWKASPIDDSTTITLTIGLQQQNIDQLESKLLAVSTPGNAEYGNHLDVDEVNALFAPSEEADTAVQNWLKGAGIQTVSSDGHWVTFAATIAQANSLLNTTFSSYSSGGVNKIRTTQYSVPDSVASYIDLISPTTFFGKTTGYAPTYIPKSTSLNYHSPTRRHRSRRQAIDASCETAITPSCLKELYSVGNYTPLATSGSRIGFGSFLNQSALYSDLFTYEQFYGIKNQSFDVVLINGGVNDQDLNTAQIGEADLDVQNIVGVSHPLPVVEFITGGSPPFIPDLSEPTAADNSNEPYLPYYQYLLSQPNSALPQVISNSYGDDEQTVPYSYAVRVCSSIGILGLRGITVLESSGDLGVGAYCKSNDGKNTTTFGSIFPASCPYLTSVGGTQAVEPEIAWVSSSGGFSNYFSTAWYQKEAVETYLTKYISPSVKKYYEPYTNFSGRGFPDISAHSLTPWYEVIYDGEPSESGGTSAASPVVAAIVGLLNDARLRAGKKSGLGFINPLLYAIGYQSLNDITGGGSVGCNGVDGQDGATGQGWGIVPYASWNATTGWDPATGLGTPNFQALKKLVLSI